jgi:hypothetical protein
MKKITPISLVIFLFTNIVYSQDIINETGKDGKFIVRDAELNEQLRVNNGNVEVIGKLKIETMATGADTDDIVVWDKGDKSLKVIPKTSSILSTAATSLQFGASSVLEYKPGGGDLWRTATRMNLVFDSDGGAEPLYFSTGNANPTLATKLMTIRTNGNVVIGTTNPSSLLDIQGSSTTTALELTSSAYTNINKISAGDGSLSIYANTTGVLGASYRFMSLGVGLKEGIRINYLGNVGMGNTSPLAKLHVSGNDGLLVQGTYGNGTIQNLGGGTRMHFYPRKAAFRAGYMTYGSPNWDDSNIGHASVAMGDGTTASGQTSVALGASTIASGGNSTAMGVFSVASGIMATAMGYDTRAESYVNTVIGKYNIGGGNGTTWVNTDPLFEIGNGANNSDRTNAMTVLKNGQMGLNVTNIGDAQLKIKIATDDNFGILVRADEIGSEIGLHTATSEYSSLAKNCYYDSDWKRFDTSKGAFLQEIDPAGGVTFRTAASGTNPIAWTGFMKFTTEGHLLMESENPYVAFYSAVTHQWTNGSSRNLKTNIKPNEIDVFEILKNVNIVNYQYKAELRENPDAMYHIGFIAEDTPQLLSGASQKGMVTTDNIGLLLAIVKEQQNTIEDLTKRLEQLEISK